VSINIAEWINAEIFEVKCLTCVTCVPLQ